MNQILFTLLGLIVGVLITYLLNYITNKRKGSQIILEAKKNANQIKKD